jgi:uncharacterized protein (DUF362 family)/Pyruvate/2-oxoacid:ferredoxin oxidoreductase delta subunit
MPRVAVAACPDYQEDHVAAAVDALLSALGDDFRVDPGERLLLKPNLLSASAPERAATTHPAVFRAVALALASRGAVLSYGDSPGIENTERVARACGIAAAAEALAIPLADFYTSEEVPFPEGLVLRRFRLARGALETDGIVDLPKFKTHALAAFTGAVKNMFGCVPGTLKAKEHVRYPNAESFSAMCVDLVRRLPPRLCVMDAVVGMEGNGPRNGTPRTVGLLFASIDPVALDAVAAAIAGLSPAEVPTTRLGGAAGLGESDLARIETLYSPSPSERSRAPEAAPATRLVAALRIPGFLLADAGHSTVTHLTRFGGGFLRKAVLNRPTIDPVKCSRCGACVRACPTEPKSLSSDGLRALPAYDYGRCIRCFCCQEMCPGGAIDVRSAPFGFLIGLRTRARSRRGEA